MKHLQLQPRLRLLADMVPAGAHLADIGTDHGYLPVWLMQQGRIKMCIRDSPKAYMPDPIHVEDQSITTAGTQKLYLGRDDADLICGKRIVLMDDVISTGGSLKAMEDLRCV